MENLLQDLVNGAPHILGQIHLFSSFSTPTSAINSMPKRKYYQLGMSPAATNHYFLCSLVTKLAHIMPIDLCPHSSVSKYLMSSFIKTFEKPVRFTALICFKVFLQGRFNQCRITIICSEREVSQT